MKRHDPESLEVARQALDEGDWYRPDLDDVYARRDRCRRRRRRRRRAAAALGAAGGLALTLWAGTHALPEPAPSPPPSVAQRAPTPDAPVERAPAPGPIIQLTDGTSVWSDDEGAECCVLEEAAQDRVVVRLERGRARFKVTPNPSRAFVVRAAQARVRVLGTTFEVNRGGPRIEVSVEEGLVAVDTPDGRTIELRAGERGAFAAARAAAKAPGPPAPPDTPREPTAEAHAPARRAAVPSWRQRARDGDHDGAAQMLEAGARPDRDDIEQLFLAADAMRLSGRAPRAMSYLERIVRAHPRDARAPLAAMTMGRIQRAELGDACAAAASFARATALGARGALAQDALIQQTRSWQACGQRDRADQALEAFLSRFPGQRHRVEHLLEPETP